MDRITDSCENITFPRKNRKPEQIEIVVLSTQICHVSGNKVIDFLSFLIVIPSDFPGRSPLELDFSVVESLVSDIGTAVYRFGELLT